MKNDDDLSYTCSCDSQVCSDHFVCENPCPLYETTKVVWVPSLSLGHKGNKLTCNTSRYDRASARAARRRMVCELLGNELNRKDNHEKNLQMEEVKW